MDRVLLQTNAIGWTSQSTSFSFDWQQVVLYALGVGAGPAQLDYVYEARGPNVIPSFALLAAMEPVQACLARAGAPMASIIHGGQTLHVLGPLKPSGTWKSTATIVGMTYMRGLARVLVEATSETIDGEPVARSQWDILVQGAEPFDSEPLPRLRPVRPPRDRPADVTFQQPTAENQALIYRLSGDINPLHVDPEVAAAVGFERGPILHGLASFGIMTRAVLQEFCDDDPSKLRTISGRFSKPVWPGETLRVQGWRERDRVILDVTVVERQQRVLSSCWAEIRS